MHKKIIVVGSGAMGLPIIYGLIKLGNKVSVVDKNESSIENACEFLSSHGMYLNGYSTYLNSFNKIDADLVVSAAPYSENWDIVLHCLTHSRRYCDLGGNPDISNKIQDSYNKLGNGRPCFTDLGLAPGFVNILCEYGAKDKDLTGANIKLMVGGLPEKPNNTLKYNKVFSLDGLYNEYTGDCTIIRNSEFETVVALSGLEDIDVLSEIKDFKKVSEFEAFNTKGGLGTTLTSMKDRSVASCTYKTIRYRGHHAYIKFLLDECKLSREVFCSAINSSCPATNEDIVLISVDIDHKLGKWVRRFIIHSKLFSAMQMTTAFPAAAVADIIASGQLDGKKSLGYADVPLDLFFQNLDKIGGIDSKLFM